VHLDQIGPRGHSEVAPGAPPRRGRRIGGSFQAEPATDRGVQPVGHGQVPRASAVDAHPVSVRAYVLRARRHHLHPCDLGGVQQRCLQGGAAHAQAGPVPEGGIDGATAVGVADAADRSPLWVHPELAQATDGCGHQALTARLVDGAGTGLEHHRAQPGPRRVQGGGQPGRSGSGDDQVGVDHRDTAVDGDGGSARACANAAFSDEIRTRSSPALTTVKTTAVIHAE